MDLRENNNFWSEYRNHRPGEFLNLYPDPVFDTTEWESLYDEQTDRILHEENRATESENVNIYPIPSTIYVHSQQFIFQ